MTISNFSDLLQATRQQPNPQRLLLVFAGPGKSEAGTPTGRLTPLMFLHKDPNELSTMEDLAAEVKDRCPPWTVVFTGALSGQAPLPPTSEQIDNATQLMVQSINNGIFSRFIPFDEKGNAVRLG